MDILILVLDPKVCIDGAHNKAKWVDFIYHTFMRTNQASLTINKQFQPSAVKKRKIK